MVEPRARDGARERQERDSFLLLLHLHNLSAGAPAVALFVGQVAHELGFGEQAARLLIHHLERGDYARSVGGSRVSITPRGAAYIEREAGRRRSVRLRHSADAQPVA
jgi:hypothetical protein